MDKDIKLNPEDMTEINNGTHSCDMFFPLLMTMAIFRNQGTDTTSVDSRLSVLEGKMDVIEKIVTK